ncbi:5'-3' exonuclease H3TH domain-containing protein [Streptomyces sp. NPDC089424]|uniref:5'-3' exonuclease n=1 Tax=Streptomyces sp. NPDC089424 TaxID=3365917 RepID=UPI0038106055
MTGWLSVGYGMMRDVTGRLMLLDTASLYFRAYFGVPDSVKAPDGTPVNAVRGLLDFIERLVRDHRPTHLVACMDADWRPQWRVDLIPSYKAHRVAEEHEGGPDEEQVPDTLSPQVPVIEAVLDALGIARVGVAGYEADDVIGTYTARAAGPVDIVTGDRDLYQLVDDARGVRVLYPLKGVGTLQLTDEAWLREKYGVAGSGYADLALLRGDPSDGLPGVPGIGEKTAAKLLAEFGDLAGILAAVDDRKARLTPTQRKRLDESRPYLSVAPTVVRVAADVPLPDVDTAVPRAPRDPAALETLSERWGLGGALRRLLTTLES